MVGDPAELRANIGDLLGVDQLRGFVAAASRNLLLHELHTERTQELFGVTHEAGFQQQTGMLEWKAKAHPGKREWIAHEAVKVESADDLRKRIQDSRTDLHRTLLTLGPAPDLETCEGTEEIRVLWRRSDSLGLRVRLPCRAAVVVADTFYPGWKAVVDGKDVLLTEAYGALRAVVAGKGEHVVRMDYHPSTEIAGIVLSLAGLLSGAIVWLRKQATGAEPNSACEDASQVLLPHSPQAGPCGPQAPSASGTGRLPTRNRWCTRRPGKRPEAVDR